MKKFAKMSLVAAVAVAGMTSANAASLTEAIKGVEISGFARYRYDDVNKTENKDGVKTNVTNKSDQKNDYDLEVNVKVPVNDMVTFNTKLDLGGADGETYGADADNSMNMDVEDMYFTFALPYATVMVGKQDIPGPMVDDAQGTGIVALVPAGDMFTFAAGYFNDHDVTIGVANKDGGDWLGAADAYELAILASLGPVNAELWYADVDDALDGYSLKISGALGPVNMSLMHTELDIDDDAQKPVFNADNEASLTKFDADATFGMFTVKAGYAVTGDDNDYGINRVSIDNATGDAASEWFFEQIELGDYADADAFYIGGEVAIDKYTFGLTYADADADNMGTVSGYRAQVGDIDADEVLIEAAYQMSSNFKISSYYSMYEEKVTDVTSAAGFYSKKTESDKLRIELKYTF